MAIKCQPSSLTLCIKIKEVSAKGAKETAAVGLARGVPPAVGSIF